MPTRHLKVAFFSSLHSSEKEYHYQTGYRSFLIKSLQGCSSFLATHFSQAQSSTSFLGPWSPWLSVSPPVLRSSYLRPPDRSSVNSPLFSVPLSTSSARGIWKDLRWKEFQSQPSSLVALGVPSLQILNHVTPYISHLYIYLSYYPFVLRPHTWDKY